jgi:hypothetical protein
MEVDLTKFLLPDEWTLYLYDRNAFKNIDQSDKNIKKQAVTPVCNFVSVNDVSFFLKLMEHVGKENIKNVYKNDYIIMRKNIKPAWEDPMNENGSIYSFMATKEIGYMFWSELVLYMIGETMNKNNNIINGMTFSNVYGKDQILIKLWLKENINQYDFYDNFDDRVKTQISSNKMTIKYSKNKPNEQKGKDILSRVQTASKYKNSSSQRGRGRGRGNY